MNCLLFPCQCRRSSVPVVSPASGSIQYSSLRGLPLDPSWTCLEPERPRARLFELSTEVPGVHTFKCSTTPLCTPESVWSWSHSGSWQLGLLQDTSCKDQATHKTGCGHATSEERDLSRFFHVHYAKNIFNYNSRIKTAHSSVCPT